MSEWRLQLWPPGGGRWPGPGGRGTRTARCLRGCGWAPLPSPSPPATSPPLAGPRTLQSQGGPGTRFSPTPSPGQVPCAHTQDQRRVPGPLGRHCQSSVWFLRPRDPGGALPPKSPSPATVPGTSFFTPTLGQRGGGRKCSCLVQLPQRGSRVNFQGLPQQGELSYPHN